MRPRWWDWIWLTPLMLIGLVVVAIKRPKAYIEEEGSKFTRISRSIGFWAVKAKVIVRDRLT